ncbi:S8 family serine peptidase [Streptomyces canus]|uniref:S8 family serine peptidase n=1 Tax=Streptomyces canus TaxID=58343 RepID=UPI00386558BA|nr:S8 family serine peptidase [Streptomyces canus]
MATGLPADLTDANFEWVLDFSNFRVAWGRTKGAGITIAHPDTGWTRHPELVPPKYRRDLSKNFLEPIKNAKRFFPPDPDSWSAEDDLTHKRSTAHGTGTAGVIVSPRGHPDGSPPHRTDKFLPGGGGAVPYVSGAAPAAQVIPFRVADWPLLLDDGDSALADCIYHCILLRTTLSIDVGVMSISLGGTRLGTERKLKQALRAARRSGIVLIAAAGQSPGAGTFFSRHFPSNARMWYPSFPGSSPSTVCVAGCDAHHQQYEMGFYGKEVDISAPAWQVWMPRTVLAPNGELHRVEQSHGTSYATALTAAACALWQSHHGRDNLIATYERHRMLTLFRYCLQQSAHRPAEWKPDWRGAGVLDVAALLDFPLPAREIIMAIDKLFDDEDP